MSVGSPMGGAMPDCKQRETSNIKASALRQALRREFGPRCYRITRDGDIHGFGVMPNTNITGWYLYGRVDDAQTLVRLGIDS